jgi:hypothetical protein
VTDEVGDWMRRQLGSPHAARRELGTLAERLRGREMPKREVMRIVEEWLGGGDEEIVEVV